MGEGVSVSTSSCHPENSQGQRGQSEVRAALTGSPPKKVQRHIERAIFYSVGLCQKIASFFFGLNVGEWMGMVEIWTRKKFLAVGKAHMAIF